MDFMLYLRQSNQKRSIEMLMTNTKKKEKKMMPMFSQLLMIKKLPIKNNWKETFMSTKLLILSSNPKKGVLILVFR